MRKCDEDLRSPDQRPDADGELSTANGDRIVAFGAQNSAVSAVCLLAGTPTITLIKADHVVRGVRR